MNVSCNWKFLLIIFVPKSSHIANYLKRVRIDRITMKKVELHVPDYPGTLAGMRLRSPPTHSPQLSK